MTGWLRNLGKCGGILLLALALLLGPGGRSVWGEPLSAERKVFWLNTAAMGTILTWGLINWDYGQQRPNAKSEEWFGRATKSGGADKFGHLYTGYLVSHLFSSAYRSWDYPDQAAARMGALSSLGVTTLMEVGDSFSPFGFSYEDMLMNTLGAGLGYAFDRYPELAHKIDLRLEYHPSLSGEFESDLVTDYEHLKYLVAIKAEGFDSIEHPLLQALELHFGYYTRGYDQVGPDLPDQRQRTLYAGIGLNVGRLLRPWWDSRLFNYLQLPFTYLDARQHLDD